MIAIVDVSVEGEERPPTGTPLTVQVRDVTYEDASAEAVATSETHVAGELGSWIGTVELEVASPPGRATVWVHADVDGDGRVSKGDYITMESFPLPSGDEVRVPVRLRKV